MIFAKLLFAHKVARRLRAMGWRRKDMPTKTMFKDLCGALRANGYNADAAAELWNKCLRYDPEAIDQLKASSGFYGILHLAQFFGKPFEAEEHGAQPTQRKPKKAVKSRKPKT
jgi:hypothetical protein